MPATPTGGGNAAFSIEMVAPMGCSYRACATNGGSGESDKKEAPGNPRRFDASVPSP